MVEVNVVRSKPFMLIRSICQGYPLSPLFYVFALKHFYGAGWGRLIIGGIKLPSAITSAKYITYANDVSTLVTNRIESDEVGREIQYMRRSQGLKLPAISLLFGFVEMLSSPGSLQLDGRSLHDIWYLVWSHNFSWRRSGGSFGENRSHGLLLPSVQGQPWNVRYRDLSLHLVTAFPWQDVYTG